MNIPRLLVALVFALAFTGCATLDLTVPRVVSHAWPDPAATTLGRALADGAATDEGKSGFYVLASGMEAFALRAALAEVTQRTLDLQYYAVHDDATGQLLLSRLLAAAKRGVRVRLLIDDLNVAGDERNLAMLAAHPNLEVRIYNAFVRHGPLAITRLLEYVTDSVRLNRRMHNKAWIADNAAAIVGGRNVGDEYFEAHSSVNFADLDLLAAGPVVRDISKSFDEYWNSESSVPIEGFVASAPTAEEVTEFERRLDTRMEVFRDTDYARILTNSLASTDAPVVHAAYARSRERLLAAGVELYEMRADALQRTPRAGESGASLHTKAVVVDREYALVGSMNLDPRSRLHNTEVAVLVENSELARSIGALFDEAIQPARAFQLMLSAGDPARIVWITTDGGAAVRHEREPLAGWWRRFLANVFAAFIPEELL